MNLKERQQKQNSTSSEENSTQQSQEQELIQKQAIVIKELEEKLTLSQSVIDNLKLNNKISKDNKEEFEQLKREKIHFEKLATKLCYQKTIELKKIKKQRNRIMILILILFLFMALENLIYF